MLSPISTCVKPVTESNNNVICCRRRHRGGGLPCKRCGDGCHLVEQLRDYYSYKSYQLSISPCNTDTLSTGHVMRIKRITTYSTTNFSKDSMTKYSLQRINMSLWNDKVLLPSTVTKDVALTEPASFEAVQVYLPVSAD